MYFKNSSPFVRPLRLSCAVAALLVFGGMSLASGRVQAAPQSGLVTVGLAQITKTGVTTTITQSTQRATIDWQSFSVAASETVLFQVPNSEGATLNRVVGTGASLIRGTVESNGILYLVNPNGIIFDLGSRVSANQFVASTANIASGDFMAGRTGWSRFGDLGKQSIVSSGTIKANAITLYGYDLTITDRIDASSKDGKGGSVTLAAKNNIVVKSTAEISASGCATAATCTVVLHPTKSNSGGGKIMIGGDFHGAGPMPTAANSTVEAGAKINANAGQRGQGGEVVVWADHHTEYKASIAAEGGVTSGDGGAVEVSGKQTLDFQGTVTTVAPHGKTGTLLLDPANVLIGDTIDNAVSGPTEFNFLNNTTNASWSVISVATLLAALATTSVTIDAAASTASYVGVTPLAGTGNFGHILVSSAVTSTSGNSLTLTGNSIIIAAAVTIGGNLTLNGQGGGAIFNNGLVNIGVAGIHLKADITTTGDLTINQTGNVGQDTTINKPGYGGIVYLNGILGSKAINVGGNLTINETGTLTMSSNDIYLQGIGLSLATITAGSISITQSGTINNPSTSGVNSYLELPLLTSRGDVSISTTKTYGSATVGAGSPNINYGIYISSIVAGGAGHKVSIKSNNNINNNALDFGLITISKADAGIFIDIGTDKIFTYNTRFPAANGGITAIGQNVYFTGNTAFVHNAAANAPQTFDLGATGTFTVVTRGGTAPTTVVPLPTGVTAGGNPLVSGTRNAFMGYAPASGTSLTINGYINSQFKYLSADSIIVSGTNSFADSLVLESLNGTISFGGDIALGGSTKTLTLITRGNALTVTAASSVTNGKELNFVLGAGSLTGSATLTASGFFGNWISGAAISNTASLELGSGRFLAGTRLSGNIEVTSTVHKAGSSIAADIYSVTASSLTTASLEKVKAGGGKFTHGFVTDGTVKIVGVAENDATESIDYIEGAGVAVTTASEFSGSLTLIGSGAGITHVDTAGVLISANLTTSGGNLTLVQSGNVASGFGIYVNASTLTASGSVTLTQSGSAGSTNSRDGIYVFRSTLMATAGSLTLIQTQSGSAGGTGIEVADSSNLTATLGAITLTQLGSAGTEGIFVKSSTLTAGGDLSLLQSGSVDSTNGIYLYADSTQQSDVVSLVAGANSFVILKTNKILSLNHADNFQISGGRLRIDLGTGAITSSSGSHTLKATGLNLYYTGASSGNSVKFDLGAGTTAVDIANRGSLILVNSALFSGDRTLLAGDVPTGSKDAGITLLSGAEWYNGVVTSGKLTVLGGTNLAAIPRIWLEGQTVEVGGILTLSTAAGARLAIAAATSLTLTADVVTNGAVIVFSLGKGVSAYSGTYINGGSKWTTGDRDLSLYGNGVTASGTVFQLGTGTLTTNLSVARTFGAVNVFTDSSSLAAAKTAYSSAKVFILADLNDGLNYSANSFSGETGTIVLNTTPGINRVSDSQEAIFWNVKGGSLTKTIAAGSFYFAGSANDFNSDLDLEAKYGGITQATGTSLRVKGVLSLSTIAGISLGNSSNNLPKLGEIIAAGSGGIKLFTTGALILTAATVLQATHADGVVLTADGDITQNGAIKVTGKFQIVSAKGKVQLEDANNVIMLLGTSSSRTSFSLKTSQGLDLVGGIEGVGIKVTTTKSLIVKGGTYGNADGNSIIDFDAVGVAFTDNPTFTRGNFSVTSRGLVTVNLGSAGIFIAADVSGKGGNSVFTQTGASTGHGIYLFNGSRLETSGNLTLRQLKAGTASYSSIYAINSLIKVSGTLIIEQSGTADFVGVSFLSSTIVGGSIIITQKGLAKTIGILVDSSSLRASRGILALLQTGKTSTSGITVKTTKSSTSFTGSGSSSGWILVRTKNNLVLDGLDAISFINAQVRLDLGNGSITSSSVKILDASGLDFYYTGDAPSLAQIKIAGGSFTWVNEINSNAKLLPVTFTLPELPWVLDSHNNGDIVPTHIGFSSKAGLSVSPENSLGYKFLEASYFTAGSSFDSGFGVSGKLLDMTYRIYDGNVPVSENAKVIIELKTVDSIESFFSNQLNNSAIVSVGFNRVTINRTGTGEAPLNSSLSTPSLNMVNLKANMNIIIPKDEENSLTESNYLIPLTGNSDLWQ